jgi:hypothetical protein
VNAVNPLVAFYDIHGRKEEVIFFCSLPDTTGDIIRLLYTDGRCGVVVGILAYYARGRGFDSLHEHVCMYWVWVFLCIICMYLQKKVYKYVLIRYLESITQAL